MDSRLRVVCGIAKTETEASREVFQTLKTRGHPDAPPPTMSDAWGGIDDAMIAVSSQVPEYSGRGRPPTQKQPQPDWQYLQMVKHRDERGHLISTELRVIFGQPKEVLALFVKSTAYIERTPLTMRLFNGRLVRHTLGFSKDVDRYRASATGAAKARLGLDPSMPAPSELYGLASRVAVLPGAAERTAIFTPRTVGELSTNRLGGTVLAEGATLFFCEAGYFTPAMKPGSEPCRRVNVVIPGNPALAVVSWERPGAALRFKIPQGKGDLSRAAAISLRVAVDPLSSLNQEGKGQAFTMRVTDGAGKTAAVHTRPSEPALQFPLGKVEDNPGFEGGLFSGRVPMTTVRLHLSDFAGVNLSDIHEIALVFDQTPGGSLLMGDVEVVRSPQ